MMNIGIRIDHDAETFVRFGRQAKRSKNCFETFAVMYVWEQRGRVSPVDTMSVRQVENTVLVIRAFHEKSVS
jgi:hypothetical protein